MAKLKEKKTEFKPSKIQDSSISKNKKRKVKRHLNKVTASKIGTDDILPLSRFSLPPSNNVFNELKNRRKSLLDSPRKVENGKSTLAKVDKLNGAGNKKLPKKFVKQGSSDSGASEDSMEPEDFLAMDEEGASDSDDSLSAEDFLDQEAEEGEETNPEDEDSGDDEMEDDSDVEDNDEDDEMEDDSDVKDNDEDEEEEEIPQLIEIKPAAKKEVPKSNKANKTESAKTAKKADETENAKATTEVQIDDAGAEKQSGYVAYIRNLPAEVTEEKLRPLLATKLEDASNILSIVFKSYKKEKYNNVFVTLKDEGSLQALLNERFKYDDDKQFIVYKARESNKAKTKITAFVPRVPTSISDDEMKKTLQAVVGDKIAKIYSKQASNKFESRNLLIDFEDEESLKKAVYKGQFKIKDFSFMVKVAFESSVQVPLNYVVVSKIPENTSEIALKKAIDSKIGANVVRYVSFSFKKNSFAFVSIIDEENKQKVLEAADDITLGKTKLHVAEFKSRYIANKRATKKQNAGKKPGTPNKGQKRKNEDTSSESPSKKQKIAENETGEKKKKRKRAKKPKKGATSPATTAPQGSPEKKGQNQANESNLRAADETPKGEIKRKKNKNKANVAGNQQEHQLSKKEGENKSPVGKKIKKKKKSKAAIGQLDGENKPKENQQNVGNQKKKNKKPKA